MPRWPGSAEDRFWARIPSGEGCRTWAGSRDRDGYGRQWSPQFSSTLAHRVAWELAYGLVPAGLQVLHTCDNPPCCNPLHLFLGTIQDNTADMVSKRRNRWGVTNRARGDRHGRRLHPEAYLPTMARGERMPHARLSPAAVREIRALHASGVSKAQIAREFGVAPSRIRAVLAGQAWAHVD